MVDSAFASGSPFDLVPERFSVFELTAGSTGFGEPLRARPRIAASMPASAARDARPLPECRPRPDALGWRRCCGSGRGRRRTACSADTVSNDHCAGGETCWRMRPAPKRLSTDCDGSAIRKRRTRRDRATPSPGGGAPRPWPTTATPDRRTSRCRRPHHLRHRRQDRLAGLGFGDQATRQLGQVIAVGSRVLAQQHECIVHRHL